MVRRPDDKGPERDGRELDQVDRHDAEYPLDAELFEECGRVGPRADDERVWIQQGTADEAQDEHREAPAKDLATVAHRDTPNHRSDIRDDENVRDVARLEVVCLEHYVVEILRCVRL